MQIKFSKHGDGLKQIAKTLTKLSAPVFRSQLNEAISKVLVKSVDQSFVQTQSPNGASWPGRKKANKTHPLLQLSSRLRTSITPSHTAAWAQVATQNVPYASYQNRGTRHIPAREFLPVNNLPTTYREKIVGVIRKAFNNV